MKRFIFSDKKYFQVQDVDLNRACLFPSCHTVMFCFACFLSGEKASFFPTFLNDDFQHLYSSFMLNMFLDYSSFNNALFCELQEEMPSVEGPTDEVQATVDEASSVMDDFQERRAQAIAAKAREIEKV